MKPTELKSGNAIVLDNDLWIVTRTEHVKPGKGPAYVQVKIKSVKVGNVLEKRLRTADDVEVAHLDRREMEYLYSDNTGHVFMDQQTYEQLTIQPDLVAEQMVYVKPNSQVFVLMYEGKPLSVDVPPTVDLQVTETTPQVKGATATNQLKEATLETGLKTRVPPFIETGEVVRINTADGSYLSRA